VTEGFRINFSGTERPKALTSMPAGMYLANIYELEWGQTSDEAKNPKEPKLKTTFKVNGGTFDGRLLFRVYTFGEKARPFFLQLCEATEKFSEEDLDGSADLYPTDIDPKLQGAEVIISVSRKADKVYGLEDGFKNEVRNVYSTSSPQSRQLASVPGDPRMP